MVLNIVEIKIKQDEYAAKRESINHFLNKNIYLLTN